METAQLLDMGAFLLGIAGIDGAAVAANLAWFIPGPPDLWSRSGVEMRVHRQPPPRHSVTADMTGRWTSEGGHAWGTIPHARAAMGNSGEVGFSGGQVLLGLLQEASGVGALFERCHHAAPG